MKLPNRFFTVPKLIAVLALLGVLFAPLAMAQSNSQRQPSRFDRIERFGNRTATGFAPPFFSLAPASGAGMGAECAGTPITASTGQSITVTRNTIATCTKGTNGLRTTGINNGDLVVLSANQPRVEQDDVGVKGILIEPERANYAERSQELNMAPWILYQDGSAGIPTVVANAAVAPDGTTTAERINYPATSAPQSSLIYQGACIDGAQCAVQFYVKGVSTSGTIDVCAGISGAACQPCAFNPTTWTLCRRSGVVSGARNIFIGNATMYNGGTTRPAQDVYVWGAQAEQSATYSTSYIPTISAPVNRAGDIAQVDLGSLGPSGNSYSFAQTSFGYNDAQSARYSGSQVAINSFLDTGSGVWTYQNDLASQKCLLGNTANAFFITGGQALSTSTGNKRYSCWGVSGNVQGEYVGLPLSIVGPTPGTLGPLRYLNIGNTGGVAMYIRAGLYTNICLDSDVNKCR